MTPGTFICQTRGNGKNSKSRYPQELLKKMHDHWQTSHCHRPEISTGVSPSSYQLVFPATASHQGVQAGAVASVKCSVHCHSSELDCANLSSLLHRTEVTLTLGVQRKRAATSTTVVSKSRCSESKAYPKSSGATWARNSLLYKVLDREVSP